MDKAGQARFEDFILQRVKDDKVGEAKKILAENFRKQDEGFFTQKDAEQFFPKILSMLKPDKVEEVNAIVRQFAKNFG